MASGENAANKLKGALHQGSVRNLIPTLHTKTNNLQEATESARQNTKSFVDNLMSDSKANTADTRAAGQNTHTTGGVDGEKTLVGGHEDAKGQTGFNKDAEVLGGAAKDGAESVAEKAKRKFYGY